MTTTQIVILVVAIVIIVVLVAYAVVAGRRRALRQKFGPEYDRAVAEKDSRTAAERELRERERKHAELQLRPLSPRSRSEYARQWAQVQARFVDAPEDAVREGDALVTRLVGEIGYPTENYDEQLATLSVEHATTLGHYRDAHDIFLRTENGEASTEQLRQALVHYRALFAELLGGDPVAAATADGNRPSPDGARPVLEAGAAEAVVPEAVVPEAGAAENATPENAAAEYATPENVAPESAAPEERHTPSHRD